MSIRTRPKKRSKASHRCTQEAIIASLSNEIYGEGKEDGIKGNIASLHAKLDSKPSFVQILTMAAIAVTVFVFIITMLLNWQTANIGNAITSSITAYELKEAKAKPSFKKEVVDEVLTKLKK